MAPRCQPDIAIVLQSTESHIVGRYCCAPVYPSSDGQPSDTLFICLPHSLILFFLEPSLVGRTVTKISCWQADITIVSQSTLAIMLLLFCSHNVQDDVTGNKLNCNSSLDLANERQDAVTK